MTVGPASYFLVFPIIWQVAVLLTAHTAHTHYIQAASRSSIVQQSPDQAGFPVFLELK